MTETVHKDLLQAWQEREQTIELVEYWRSINKRKWSIFALALVITLAAAVVVMMVRPVYRSTASLLIEQNKSKVLSIEEVYSGISANREYFQTQAEILKSRELARKVVLKLNLLTHPEFDPRQQEKPFWKKWAASAGYVEPEPTSEGIEKAVVEQLSRQLSVEPIRLSHLIKVHFESHDRELAAAVANAIADTYIDNDLEARYLMTQKAGEWLSSRLSGLKEKLSQSEKALQDFRERERIVDTKGMALSGITKQLEDITRNLVDARMKRGEAESAFNQVKAVRASSSPQFDSLPAVVKNPLIARLKETEAETEKKVAELSNRYGKEHPKMVQAEAELRTSKENTRRQVENVVLGLTKEYEVARANEQSLERSIAEVKGQIQGFNRKEFELGVLEREVQSSRQIYEMFVARFKETTATNNMQSTIARVVDPAIQSASPIKPNKTQIVAIAFILGLFFAIMVAFLLDRLDNTIKNTDDAEHRLGLPVLTTIPKVHERNARPNHLYLDDPKSVFAETIRTARTSVLLSAIDELHKVLVITSSVPNEGKTTFAMNLAFAHAQTKKVLLIDADMRRPMIGKSLGIDQTSPGLSDLVSGTANASQCIYPIEGTEALLLPAGNVPPNPLELLLSQRFKDLVTRLKERFDIIIIDTPPVQLVSDSLVVASESTGVIYVVKADETPYKVATQGVKRLRKANAPLIGAVLNQLDFKKADKYYGEYSGYGKSQYQGYYGAYGNKAKA
ncbi:MAG: polysaccharide biosynthesis tyrosine autokinase [Betaproteobacteria bacterium]|nr:polysaccharide biosynthesis tyrosine autokinase [Betaproteobacteria bacterium]